MNYVPLEHSQDWLHMANANTSELVARYRAEQKKYERFMESLIEQLQALLSQCKIATLPVKGRCKEPNSLSAKIDAKQKYTDLSQITDLVGVRVITYYRDDVDKLAQLVEACFEVDKVNSIDKRKVLESDRFGYLSLHYVVSHKSSATEFAEFAGFKGELQLRSILQHAWAETEHGLRYKGEDLPVEIKRRFSRLAGLLEVADAEFEGIRSDIELYKKRVKETIGSNPQDFQLDIFTLAEFVETDANATVLDELFTEGGHVRLLPSEFRYEALIHVLRRLGVVTISQLKDLVQTHSLLIRRIAGPLYYLARTNRFNHDTSLARGVSLWYLACVILAERNDRNGISTVLQQLGQGREGHQYLNPDLILRVCNQPTT